MIHVKRRLLVLGASLLVTLSPPRARAEAPAPSLDAAELARGPYSAMHMLLTKTFLQIRVATVDVRFDKQAQDRFGDLARGKSYNDGLGQQLAQVAIGADHAVVQMRFERDVSLDQWMGVVRDNMQQARSAGFISRELEQHVSQGLPQWFAALHDRGYKRGDRLVYALGPDAFHTVVVAVDGPTLVDREDHDPGTRRVVLASYFAPHTDTRDPLLHSLFEAH
jgi:hypothetical protein